MIKCRLTFVDNEQGKQELDYTIKQLKKSFEILNESKIYKGRGRSQYSNIYIDLDRK